MSSPTYLRVVAVDGVDSLLGHAEPAVGRAEILLEVVQRYLCRKASSSCTLTGSAMPMQLTRVEVGLSL